MPNEFRLLVNGRFVDGADGFDVVNPATGDGFAKCPKADPDLLEQAVAAAKAAFPGWAARDVAERGDLVHALADALEPRTDEFARLLTLEQGKPLIQAQYEIMGCVAGLRQFAAMRPEQRVIRQDDSGTVIEHRKPLGVVAAIMPWNFPLLLFVNKLGPALVSGNTVVAKPAPSTPLTTLLFGTICQRILPPGVVNIICDEHELGPALSSHPDVAKVAFTGSTVTGRKVMEAAAGTIKRVTLELGGNDAALVLDDVDPRAVAARLFDAAMINAGQVCVAVKRVYVPAALCDAICDELARLAEAAVVDDGLRPETQIGPVQNRAHFEKLTALLDDVRKEGAVLTGGTPLDRPGFFIPPTIVRDIPETARLVQEEQFGPILPIIAYTDVEAAVDGINASPFGLGGSVWGADAERAMQVAMRIDAGTVWVNQHLVSDNAIPFRGAKQSGLGAELGQEGFHEYTQPHIINAMFQ